MELIILLAKDQTLSEVSSLLDSLLENCLTNLKLQHIQSDL
jgi:hypothetical protein